MENKITEEQLTKIQDQQTQLAELLNEIGTLETQKHAALHKIVDVNIQVEKTKQELESEYGPININMEDGSYLPIEK